jgi:tRNA G10  N-methylase Trm11/DNA-directed RNA polymerase subunit M/transcription elongation factor TFIIS
MKSLRCVINFIAMTLIQSLITKTWRSRSLVSYSKFLSKVDATSSNSVENWHQFMIEFKGVQPVYRLDEFRDAYKQVMGGITTRELVFTTIISDALLPSVPVCAYVHMPNESVAIAVTNRCSLVRSISQIWGNAPTAEEVRLETENNFPTLIAPLFNKDTIGNSWRVNFRRYGKGGRSGLDPDGKRKMLNSFNKVLRDLNGTVSLDNAQHDLLYLEDWSTYRSWLEARGETLKAAAATAPAAVTIGAAPVGSGYRDDDITENPDATESNTKTRKKMSIEQFNMMPDIVRKIGNSNKNVSTYIPSIDEINHDDGSYIPLRCVLSRVLAEGPNIMTDYDVKKRPFIGTTTMDAVVSHIAAVAARIGPGDLILDPFCGTGSLLIACASLGANVVGSDIDDDNFNSTMISAPDLSDLSVKKKAKNSSFQRHGLDILSQVGKSTVDNFIYYGLQDRLVGLIAVDAALWAAPTKGVINSKDIDSDVNRCSSVGSHSEIENSDSNSNSVDSSTDHNRHESMSIRGSETYPSDSDDVSSKNSVNVAHSTERTHSTERIIGIVQNLDKYGKFDAIVTDPPYSRRERAQAYDKSRPMGDPLATTSCLLSLANSRLKKGGRLVFWLPTDAFITEIEVRALLQEIESESSLNVGGDLGLEFVRAVPEELNRSLWRWLCVYTRS